MKSSWALQERTTNNEGSLLQVRDPARLLCGVESKGIVIAIYQRIFQARKRPRFQPSATCSHSPSFLIAFA